MIRWCPDCKYGSYLPISAVPFIFKPAKSGLNFLQEGILDFAVTLLPVFGNKLTELIIRLSPRRKFDTRKTRFLQDEFTLDQVSSLETTVTGQTICVLQINHLTWRVVDGGTVPDYRLTGHVFVERNAQILACAWQKKLNSSISNKERNQFLIIEERATGYTTYV